MEKIFRKKPETLAREHCSWYKILVILAWKIAFSLAFRWAYWDKTFALSIIDTKVVTEELQGPTKLSGAQALDIHELAKVVMVCENKNLVFTTF